jgi:membrane protease YdiL (CAAX protease family)
MQRFSALVYALVFVQMVSAMVAIVHLADARTRTGWAQSYGVFSAGFAWMEALFACTCRIRDLKVRRWEQLFYDTLMLVAMAVVFVGVVALICNTEDGKHGDQGLVNVIEGAAIALVWSWGTILVRAGGRYVEFAHIVETGNAVVYDVQL